MHVASAQIDRELALQDRATPFQEPVTILQGAKQAAPDPLDDFSDDLTQLVQWFEEAEDMTHDARELSERDRDYYDNKQWTAKESAILRKRGQPELTINYIKRKVEFMRGFERRMRSDPKAFPRNPQDEQGAGAATDCLRFVADQNDFDETRSSVYENLIIEGYGGADVTVREMPNGEKRIDVERVPWDRLWYDPHSRLPDFSDAAYKGIVIWMDATKARERWSDYAESISETFKSVSLNDTYSDRPGNKWCDSKRKRIRVVQCHYERDGEWMVCTFTKGGFLEEPQVSPYKDKYGKSMSSLVMRSAYIDRENNRYGSVRDLISVQDEINKRRSKALHLNSVRQTYGTRDAVIDTQKTKQEMAKPDGHVELNGMAEFGKNFGILPTGDMAQAQVMLMQQAVMEMQASGPNAAMAGKDPRAQSGRALEAQAQGGSIEMEPLVDELRQWSRDIYESIWMRARQFWTDETWVRVTDDERNVKFVGLNKKVTVADRLAQMEPQMQAAWMQKNGIQPGDPRLQEVIGVENEVSGLDVDIVVEEGPDVAVLQSEQFEQLSKLAQSGIAISPKALIMASSLRNKDAILDELESGKQLPPEVQKQLQELQQQLQALTQENQQLKGDRAIDMAKLAHEDKKLELEQQSKGQAAPGPEPLTPKDMADVELKRAQAAKTIADAEQTEVETLRLRAELAFGGVTQEVDAATGQKRMVSKDAASEVLEQVMPGLQALFEQQQAVQAQLQAPKTIVRDPATNELMGVQQGDQFHPIVRDESGLIAGLE